MSQNDLFNPDYERFIQAMDKQPEFDGAVYDTFRDKDRLTAIQKKLFEVMKGGGWFSIPELEKAIDSSQTGISAGIRNFRKVKFGGYKVERKYQGRGFYLYRLDVNGYDEDSFEYFKKVQILKWKCNKVIEAHRLFNQISGAEKMQLCSKYQVSQQGFGGSLMTFAYSASIFLAMLEAKSSRLSLTHLRVLESSCDEWLKKAKLKNN